MAQVDHVLTIKLNVPRLRTEHLGRSRLIQRLDEGITRELTLVCTPAGFGKTSLLAEWAAGARLPVSWLSLDPEDSDPARFWRYVVLALDRACPGIAEQVLPLLGPGSVTSGQGVVSALGNALGAPASDVALVLDDYHVMSSRAIHSDIAYLLSRMPPRLHMVMASRSDPPLPLARLRAGGQLTELRAADLRFTEEESSALLRDVWRLDLPADAIGELAAKTEGWAVGLQLAALSMRERPDADASLRAFAGTHRYVLDYLSEEVLERQSEDTRAFLLDCSILDRLSASSCDAVTGRTDSDEMLAALERANLFLVPLDDDRQWYRFHHLFGDLLRARLQRTDRARLTELHHKAARWHEQSGMIDAAIRHALAAGDWSGAAGLVEGNLNDILRRGERVILEGWLSALPENVVQARPVLSFARAEIEFHLGHIDAVDRLLEHADGAMNRDRDGPVSGVPTDAGMVAEQRAAVALLRARTAGVRGDADRQEEYARSAIAQMDENAYGARFWARWLAEGGAAWLRGQVAEAERVAARMLAEGRAAPDHYPLLTSCYSLAGVQRAQGKLTAALTTYRESLRRVTEGGRSSLFHEAEAHVGIAQVLYERNQLDDALRHVLEGIERGKQVIWFFEPGRRLVTLAWIHHARGDPAAAIQAMDEACEAHPNPAVVSLWIPAHVERARLLLAQGRTAEAVRWTRERGLSDEDPIPYPRERDYLVLARVLIVGGEPDRALRLLDRLDTAAQADGRIGSLIEIRALSSLAAQAAGNHHRALSTLADALALAQPEGYVRVFVDEGRPMAGLMQSLVRAMQRERRSAMPSGVRDHLNRIVHVLSAEVVRPRDGAPTASSIGPLTRREIEILELIAAGERNQEIADRLVVTLDTVKRHATNIFNKLGATNRIDAVSRARQLRLIP